MYKMLFVSQLHMAVMKKFDVRCKHLTQGYTQSVNSSLFTEIK
jgi:hypothetical protein